jgi:Fe-S-cluster-containing dehydrogenase component
MRYGIAVDTEKCMACYNCVMACKDEHCGFATSVSAPQPHEGQFWVNIQSRERGDDNRKVKTINVPVFAGTMHTPAEEKAVAEGTMVRRGDGITYIDPEKAKGHKELLDISPVGGIYWNEELQLPQKCTMCAHLLDEGYTQPRCVEACPNEVLYFGDLDDPNSEVSRVIAENKVTPLPGTEGLAANVVYLNLPTVFLAGSVYLPGDETGEDPADGASVVLVCRETGERLEGKTNYFGDWEFDNLGQYVTYDIEITYPGYRPVKLAAQTDMDHYVAEIILSAEKS